MEKSRLQLASIVAVVACLLAACVGPASGEVVVTEPIRTFTGHGNHVTSVAFSPDGTRVLSGGYDRTAKLWDVSTGTCIRTFTGHSHIVLSVAFSPDGTRVLTGSHDNTAKLWDAATGACIRTFTESLFVWSVAFSPDGTRVLTGRNDGTARLWDAATGACIRTFTGHTSVVWSVAFSPDGTRVLTGSYDYTAKLWDAATGDCIRTFTGQTGEVVSVAFSPDGTRVLTGSRAATLWDAATGDCIRTFTGHTSSVTFSPDGTRVLAGGYDNTARLWDPATGACIRTFRRHTDSVSSVAFSPDGTRALTGSWDTTAMLWQAGRVLAVRSTPIAGAAMTGSRPGTTNYTATCDDQEMVTLVAPKETPGPDFAYVFVRWSADGIAQPDGIVSVSVTMDADHSVEASYVVARRKLIVQSVPVAGVSVSGSRPGTANYTASCADTEVVNLTVPAVASIGGRSWFFEYWVVDGQPKWRYIPVVSLTMDADHTATTVYDYAPAGDIDGNCSVNVLDLILLRNRLGQTCSQ